MTEIEFGKSMERLIGDFGQTNFKRERMQIIWKTVCDLSGQEFDRICTHFLSSMRQAPLPKDFEEQARLARKSSFDRMVNDAVNPRNWQNGLGAYLKKEYGAGCKTLSQAVEIQVLRNQVAKAKGE